MKNLRLTILFAMLVAMALALPVNAADIALTKGVNPQTPNTYHRGETIHYVMTVHNAHGSETIRIDTVRDTEPNAAVVNLTIPSLPYDLGPGATQNYTLDWVVSNNTPGGIAVNSLRVTGVQHSTFDDPFDVTVEKGSMIIVPCVDVTKTVTPTVSAVGGQVTYHIRVCNCGDTTLTRDSVIDIPVLGTITSSFPTTLTAQQCSNVIDFPYTIPEGSTDPNCDIVTAIYHDILGLQVDASDEACVDLVKPGLKVEKDCSEYSKVGDTIDYEVTITNTGEGNLVIDSVVDDPNGPIDFSSCSTPLAPAATCTLNYTHVVQPGEDSGQPGAKLTNTVTVTTHLADVPAVTVSQSATCDTILVHPDFTVEKTCVDNPVQGATARYQITITNTGDIPLLIHTNDANIPNQTLSNTPGLNVISKVVTRTVPAGATEVCNNLEVIATLPALYNLANSITKETGDICCQVPGLEGCTLGFWKNSIACWCDSYLPGDKLDSVFDFDAAGIPQDVNALRHKTLLQALQFPGGSTVAGKAQNMLRQAVAALLNACSENVESPLNTQAVIDMVNDALINTFKLGTVQNTLETYNKLGCPLSSANAKPCPCCRK